jgi:hypothetical protein
MTGASTLRLLAATLVLALAPAAEAAGAERPRPTDLPALSVHTATAPNGFQVYNDYASPARVFAAERAAVHYVVLGIDAPPLNDDDSDGVPDYVERVGEAADRALAYFERRGFRPVRPDRAGPDTRPDLYVSRFAPGTFGVAFPASRAAGGAFAVVSNSLDPSAGESFASLWGTVAHELFHLVQFSYFPPGADPPIPAWTLEGSAAALERRVHPELDDLVATLQLRRWLAAPHRSITTQTYGAQALWHHLDRRAPRLLPAYLERLAARPVRDGGKAALAVTFARVARRPFAAEFHAFALDAAREHGSDLTAARTLRAGARHAAFVPAFAIHYLRLARPAAGRPLEVTVRLGGGGTRPHVSLVHSWASEVAGNPDDRRRVAARASDSGRTLRFRIEARVHGSDRFRAPLLVVSNGSPGRTAAYRIAVSER